MKKTIIVAIITVINIGITMALNTNDSIKSYNPKSYSFILQDSPSSSYSMRQFNQNYISSYGFLSEKLYANTPKKIGYLIQYFSELFLLPLTHEEGHRSILTSMNIGSISQPYFNSKGAAYVKGVRDVELIALRKNNLPSYIRLHTAGLESDFMLCNRIEEMLLFGFESNQNLKLDFIAHKLSLLSYYTFCLIPDLSPKLTEEPNEIDRDIVGHDVYGAIKNLHRPNIPFYRYTDYEDLTLEELGFVKRVGYRALLNLVSPVFIKSLNVINKKDFKLSVSTGYTMCPFGDFIDENYYIQYNQKYNIHGYFRQFENRNTWFMGGGLSLVNYQFNTTIAAHVWSQPKNLDFNTTESQFGGAGDLLFKYIVLKNKSHNSISIDLGLNYKTYGFLPEEVYLKEHVGIRFGLTVNFIRK